METLPLELITEILSRTTHKDLASARLVSSRFYEAALSSIFARKEKFVYNKHYNRRSFSTFTQTLLISKRKIYHLHIYHTDINNELETLLVKQGEFIESIRFKSCSINPDYFWKYINSCIHLKSLIFENCNDDRLVDYALEHLDQGHFKIKALKLKRIKVSARAFGNVCGGEQRLSFCESLKDLEHLNLALCPGLDDFSLTNYFKLPSLKSLSIFGCENVGEEGFKSLVDNYPYLESLNIGETMASVDTVVYLARSMKCLRILILQSQFLRIRSLLNTLLETSKCPEIVIYNGTGYRRLSDEAKYRRIKLDYPEYSHNWLQDAVMSI